MRRLARDRRGASAVEFALVIVPFVLLLFTVVEYGRLLFTRHAFQEIASETARCMGIVAPACADAAQSYSEARTRSLIAADARAFSIAAPAATLSRTATCAGVGGFSQATLTGTFATAVPGLMTALAGGVRLSATACYPNQ